MTVFEVLEVDVDGDPERVKIQAEGNAPGRYPITYKVTDLIAAA